MKKYLISFIFFLIAITLTGCSGIKTNKVDLNKVVSVEITGCDGYGEASIQDSSYDAIITDDVFDNIANLYESTLKEEDKEFVDMLGGTKEIVNTNKKNYVELYFPGENTGLSNGDTVKVGARAPESILNSFEMSQDEYFKKIGLNFKSLEAEIKVEGLEKADVLDALSLAKDSIVWNGPEGFITGKVEFPTDYSKEIDGLKYVGKGSYLNVYKDDTQLGYLYFKFEDENLSSDEKAVLSVIVSDSSKDLQEYYDSHNIVVPKEYKVKVPYNGEFLSSKEEVTDDIIDNLTKLEDGWFGNIIESGYTIDEVFYFEADPKQDVYASKSHNGVIISYVKDGTDTCGVYQDIVIKDEKFVESQVYTVGFKYINDIKKDSKYTVLEKVK